MTVRYKHGGKLVGDRTAKSHLSGVRITELQCADDAAVYASTRAVFERATSGFDCQHPKDEGNNHRQTADSQ